MPNLNSRRQSCNCSRQSGRIQEIGESAPDEVQSNGGDEEYDGNGRQLKRNNFKVICSPDDPCQKKLKIKF